MTLGEIKIEALKLMFTNYADDIAVSGDGTSALTLQEALSDDIYRRYLVNMPGSINRCFGILENRHVLPNKIYPYNVPETHKQGEYIRIDTTGIADFLGLQRIILDGARGYNGAADFYIDGTEIVIPDVLAGETCKLVYWPRITRLTQTTLDTAEIGVPDNIAVLIPYYIKGDLYRNDDPNEAGEARNWFEAGVSDIVGQRAAAQGTVHTVFSQTWG